MKAVSRWELFGVPMTAVFFAAYRLKMFAAFGITDEQLPDLMLLAFFAMAILRGGIDAWKEARSRGVAKP